MSAINTLTFQSVFVFPRTHCACMRIVAEDVIEQAPVPIVSPRWSVETGADGTRRLVQHWFKNDETPR
jgi:hypothetical protein